MHYEAIILCGGKGWRLKPDTWTPKPLLKISSNETLVDRQIRWLLSHGFSKIVLASDRLFPESAYHNNPAVQTHIEKEKLGTGGALKEAATLIKEDQFYALNVDDIVFYNPRDLFEYATRGAAVLVAQPILRFGRIHLKGDIVARFDHRPALDIWVSAGHYVFSKELVESHFPSKGNFEIKAMKKIATKGYLRGLVYNGDWLTVNTIKDLMKVKEYLETGKPEKKEY